VRHDEAAIVALGEVIIQEPDFVEAFLNLPVSDADRDIFAMLAATLRRALDRHPDYADLHFHCSRVYERLGRTDAAIDEARSAVRINPRYVQALITLGRLYGQTNRTNEAVDRLESAIAAGGDYPDVHLLLGDLYRGQGKRLEAAVAYHRALELNSNYQAAREALEVVAG
jgi:tetratricopeptide (TPR) repeat protein